MGTINIAIKYNPLDEEYNIYEPSTDTLLLSKNLTEGLVNLNNFLIDSGMTKTDILKDDSIEYHLCSKTMKAMIDSNVKLIKKLSRGPSEFQVAKDRFGSSPLATATKKSSFTGGQQTTSENRLKSNINESLESKSYKKSEGFRFGSGFSKKGKF